MMLMKMLTNSSRGSKLLGRSFMPATASRSWLVNHNETTSKCCMSSSSNNHGGHDGGTTYYDSQSGQHVPIHDENKITAYVRARAGKTIKATSPYAKMLLDDAKEFGMAGSLLTLPRQPYHQGGDGDDDGILEYLESLGNSIAAKSKVDKNEDNNNEASFNMFLHIPLSFQLSQKMKQLNSIPGGGVNCNVCFEFNDNNAESIAENIRSPMARGIDTSIGIFNPSYYIDQDPISVASQIATLIDTTAEKGGGSISNIILCPASYFATQTDEKMKKRDIGVYGSEISFLCEELSYLDVTGPTIKSRLIVSIQDYEDQLADCLDMGISKFIVNNDDEVDVDVDDMLKMLRWAVEDYEKELVLVGK